MHTRSHPEIALLSNGSYGVMITSAGGGSSTWRDLDVTRWREDATRDCWGTFFYVRDLVDNTAWSAGAQPLVRPGDEIELEARADRVELRRRNGDIETHCAICVAPDADGELRVVTLINHGNRRRDLELTSYAEVCLNARRADQAHPAFAKLFLETEFDPRCGALIARRRPRAAKEWPLFAIHSSVSGDASHASDANEASGASGASGANDHAVEYETDRARFLGRGRTPANPASQDSGSQLSGTTGPVLDPIFSLRRRVALEPGATARIAFVTGAADTRDSALAIAERFSTLESIDAAFAAATNRAAEELRELGIAPADVALFNQLAASVVYTGTDLRDPNAVSANRLGQRSLWPYAISGDLPIVLARVAHADDEAVVRELVRWRAWAVRRHLKLDLVILDERAPDRAEGLRQELRSGVTGDVLGKPGGIFHLTARQVPASDAVLLAAAARAVLGRGRGTLAEHFEHDATTVAEPPELIVPNVVARTSARRALPPNGSLRFWNGLGGFSQDGREYIIRIDRTSPAAATLPPAPWTNVLANPQFGCLVTEGGLGYTWSGNSQMNRLTPWSNDPVSDPPGEVLYLRDEDTGEFWTPTPLPLGPMGSVTISHGQGYTRYAHMSRDLVQDLLVFVPPDDPVKILRLTLRNDGDRPRRLSVTYYVEWVLGTVRENAPLQVVCDHEAEIDAVVARNAWAGDFSSKIAFLACGLPVQSVTADRHEFLGEHGSTAAPAAMRRVRLPGGAEPGRDPCAAIRTELTVVAGETRDVVFVLGQAGDAEEMRRLIGEYTPPHRARPLLADVRERWDRHLDALQVATPDPAVDLMLNRWLLYQVLGCRVWARSAFYQSGGAYGFRDQLQDVMALVYGAPEEARAQILRAAARQFEEGDVQHWWHPPSGVGVRTRMTDDLYFLPFVVHHYVVTTGDAGVLSEVVPFITAPLLREDQEEDFNSPAVSAQTATVYEHCLRALEHGYKLGVHGLPLMGTGDWNDGMNKVGAEGRGESVWNGWFFLTVLGAFAELAERCGKPDDAGWCRERVEQLRANIEANAWDGAWYLRAYFDDGTPLGSSRNDECQIDALPQTWAVISGAADPERARSAMDAVEERLVRADDTLIQLFDPPFDKGVLQPGYIKGYVPGIRENGGQYTHAATWVVLATALQGRGDRAMELWNLINPISHAMSAKAVQHYKVEPYVVCADVYGAPPHTGRGGWTWYTGSAGWLYRVAVEAMLGFQLRGDTLRLAPCVPRSWPKFELRYRYRSSTYRIVVDNSAGTGRGVRSIELDGQRMPDDVLPLNDDAKTHHAFVRLG
jgi:cellobiose phosphorylase